MKESPINTLRCFARFIVEADTPLAVGSGEKGLETDRIVVTDANGLPYIPGTSLAGVIRHELNTYFDKEKTDNLFGFQLTPDEIKKIVAETGKKKDDIITGRGSRIIFSPALLTEEDGKTAIEGLRNLNFSNSDYLSWFSSLPNRDHVRINHKGTAVDKGKFDEELVPKGSRFVFEIEVQGSDEDKELFEEVLQTIHQPFFRIGAGTRKGFGKLKVIECKTKIFDLTTDTGLNGYLNKSSALSADCSDWESPEVVLRETDKYYHYKVRLCPEDFFFFGAGFGDEDADNIQKTERFIDWTSGKPTMSEKEERVLIPATSVKGAISHRTAFHYNDNAGDVFVHTAGANHLSTSFDAEKVLDAYNFGLDLQNINESSDSETWNKLEEQVKNISFEDFEKESKEWLDFKAELQDEAENKEEANLPVFENNIAVRTLFGYANNEEEGDGARGNVIFSDVYKEAKEEKIFNHVSIDRFTGGGIDGALFQEKVVRTDAFTLDIHVAKAALTDPHIKKAFENALDDLKNGKLQLGGNTAKGHGVFLGDYTITNQEA